MNDKLKFAGRILDNVHGFINYTEAEGEIINLRLFKRLQSIKQLSVANWIFPGSEHTRFIHSLGVMHICDKIAIQLKLSDNERKIVRFAGLLHDIGHYPLSHVCELPYKKELNSIDKDNFCISVNREVKEKIDKYSSRYEDDYMKQSQGYHHECIGASIIKNDADIKRIIEQECGAEAIEIICDMIEGNVEREKTDPLLVQILHSEIDADGIDYMMRDAVFSGTSFGSFELDQLIGSMVKKEVLGKNILCITPKGISAADQYLINKFFSYSQIIYNKHISILEWMAEHIVDWMQKTDTYFPAKKELDKWIKEDTKMKYLAFTDNYFWSRIEEIINNPGKNNFPPYILVLCKKLLQHEELKYVDRSEVKIIADSKEIIKEIKDSNTYKRLDSLKSSITIFSERSMTKQYPSEVFEEIINQQVELRENGEEQKLDEDQLNEKRRKRLMEGICVYDNGKSHLLVDDKRSLLRSLYSLNLVILREYNLEV